MRLPSRPREMRKRIARRSVDSRFADTTTSSKRQRRDNGPRRGTESSDSFLAMLGDVNGQLKSVTENVGKMATAMEREAIFQEKAMQDEPHQRFKEKAIHELRRLGFTGSDIINATSIFAKASEQMHMMLALPETLRRKYVVKMLNAARNVLNYLESLYQAVGCTFSRPLVCGWCTKNVF